MLANPPFGVEWKKVETQVKDEHDDARLRRPLRRRAAAHQRRQLPVPAAHDQQDEAGRARAARGSRSSSTARRCSPARAGSGECEIRRWIIENDWLEAIVALPDQLFYNTGISTYIWLVTNAKAPHRRGRCSSSTRASSGRRCPRASARSASGSPRRDRRDHAVVRGLRGDRDEQGLRQRGVRVPARDSRAAACGCEWTSPARRSGSTRWPASSAPRPWSRGEGGDGRSGGLGSPRIALADATAPITKRAAQAARREAQARARGAPAARPRRRGRHATGRPEPDPELRDHESIPLTEDVEDYIAREVLPARPRRLGRRRARP